MPKILNENELTKKVKLFNNDPNRSYAESMNCFYSCKIIKPKIMIIGTLTPPGGRGYYYTAKGNKMYDYINAGIKNLINITLLDNLKDLSKETMNFNSTYNRIKECDSNGNAKIIKNIHTILANKGIYFFDVYNKAIRKNKYSPSDNDIEYATLDYNRYEKIDVRNCVLIANSRLALKEIKCIIKKTNNFPKLLMFCPQISYHEKNLLDKWVSVLKYAYYGSNNNKTPYEIESYIYL